MGVKLARALQNNGYGYNNIPMNIPFSQKDFVKSQGARWNFKDKTWELSGEMEFETAKIAIRAICEHMKCKPEEIGIDSKILDMPAETKEAREAAIKAAATVLFTHPEQVICFDTETTGFSKWDEILQMSIYGTNGPIYNSYFKPERRKTWRGAEAVNHISPEMVADSPSFFEEKKKLQEIFNNARVIIGHNVDFDIKKISWNGLRVENAIILDTLELFKLDKEAGSHKLIDAITYYRPDLLETFSAGAHDSNTDTWGTIEVFKAQMEKYRDLVKDSLAAQKLEEFVSTKEEIPSDEEQETILSDETQEEEFDVEFL